MVRPPYWVAARIYAAASDGIIRARISGSYTLATGRRVDDLDPDLYLDAVEAWLWDHITEQRALDEWRAEVDADPWPLVEGLDDLAIRAVTTTVALFMAADAAPGAAVDDSPPGWSDAELLAEHINDAGGVMVIE